MFRLINNNINILCKLTAIIFRYDINISKFDLKNVMIKKKRVRLSFQSYHKKFVFKLIIRNIITYVAKVNKLIIELYEKNSDLIL